MPEAVTVYRTPAGEEYETIGDAIVHEIADALASTTDLPPPIAFTVAIELCKAATFYQSLLTNYISDTL